MPNATLALLDGIANVVIAAAALGVAVAIASHIGQRSTARREPLGIAVCIVFLAVGVSAITQVSVLDGHLSTAALTPVRLAADVLAMAALFGFLLLHRRFGVLVEGARMVREFETEY